MNLRLSDVVAPEDPYAIAEKDFAKKIREETDGRIDISVFPGGQLGDDLAAIDGVKLGSIDMAVAGTTTSTVTDCFYLPYLFKSAEHQLRVMDSEIGQQIKKRFREDVGIVMVGAAYFAPRQLTTSNKEVQRPDDLGGLKIRVPQIPLMQDTWDSLGASPTPINFTELYSALQQGTVQAQENPINLVRASSFYEVQNLLMLTKHALPMRFFVINEEVWNRLGEEDQNLFRRVWDEVAVDIKNMYIDNEKEDLQFIKDKGMKVIEVDVEPFRNATDDVWRDYAPEAWGEGVYQQIQEMR